MIEVLDVHKRYQTDHGPGPWVLSGVTLTLPPRTNVGLIGRNGAGKSTLLRLIGGVDEPTRGRVRRHTRVSWPMGFGGGLQGTLTGRQNAKFVCRIHGHAHDMADRLQYIQDFAQIGAAFDEPVKTYSSGMKARLQFALSREPRPRIRPGVLPGSPAQEPAREASSASTPTPCPTASK